MVICKKTTENSTVLENSSKDMVNPITIKYRVFITVYKI